MADWTAISNANVEPDAPFISATVFALRDNPIAIAEGATGAPRIQTAALKPPGAGGTLIMRILEGTATFVGRGGTAQYDSAAQPKNTGPEFLGFNCLVPGTVRISFDHRCDVLTETGFGSYVRILRNGVSLSEWIAGENTTAFISRSYDLSVSLGDLVIVQHLAKVSNEGNCQLRNVRVSSSGPNIAVC